MNPENQLRLVRLRSKNLQDEITLVYSKEMLSDRAQQDLLSFCHKHNITSLSFEEEVKPKLSTHEEQELMQLIEMELRATKTNTGGNLAAASDMTRLLSPVYKRGIYSDCDVVDIDTKGLPAAIPVNAPFIANIGSVKIFDDLVSHEESIDPSKMPEVLVPNNDIFAIPEIDTTVSTEEQREALEQQNRLLSKYYQIILASYNQMRVQLRQLIKDKELQFSQNEIYREFRSRSSTPGDEFIQRIIENNYGDNPIEMRRRLNELPLDFDQALKRELQWLSTKHAMIATNFLTLENCYFYSAFQFDRIDLLAHFYANMIRSEVRSLWFMGQNVPRHLSEIARITDDRELVRKMIELNYSNLYKLTVTLTTGPNIMPLLFKRAILPAGEVDEELGPYSFQYYGQLKDGFKSAQRIGFHTSQEQYSKWMSDSQVGISNDAAWTTMGREAVQKREQKMHSQASLIQSLYRKRKGEKQSAQAASSSSSHPADAKSTKETLDSKRSGKGHK